MLWSNFVKFLMSILKRQVNSFPKFVSLFSVMKDDSSAPFLAQTIYTLFKRCPLKWKDLLRLSSAQVKIVKFLMPILKWLFYSSPNFEWLFSVMKDNSSVPFLAQTIYILLKRSTLKWEFLRLSSARVKIRQILHVKFKATSQFFFKFCIIFHCHGT